MRDQELKNAIANKNPPIEIIDPKGRRIVLRKPKSLKEYNLIRVLGDDASRYYSSMCTPLIWIESIDDYIVPPIEKKLHIDQLIELLDDEGIDAVNEAVLKNLEERNRFERFEGIEEIKKS